MITQDVIIRYRWFRNQGVGGIVGQDAMACLSFARAESLAEEIGLVAEWCWDEDPDNSWFSDKDIEDYGNGSLEVLHVSVSDAEGTVLASLGGVAIHANDRNYQRMIEAEVFLEAIGEIKSCRVIKMSA